MAYELYVQTHKFLLSESIKYVDRTETSSKSFSKQLCKVKLVAVPMSLYLLCPNKNVFTTVHSMIPDNFKSI